MAAAVPAEARRRASAAFQVEGGRTHRTLVRMLPADLAAARDRYHLLDVRERDEWDAGHIDGARHIPLAELAARLDEVPRDKVVVCVCRSGHRSEAARQGLDRMGIAAENLEGGMAAWARAGLAHVSSGGAAGRVI